MPLLIHNSVAVGHIHNSLSVGHMHKVHKDMKAPFLMSGCKVADGYGTMLRDPSIRQLTSRHMILSGRITAHWFLGLLGSYLRWIQLITCLLLSRCYVTSSITVEQMYTEMASRHRVCHHCIQIIKTSTIPAKFYKRESTKQFHNSKIKFPLVFKKVRPPT